VLILFDVYVVAISAQTQKDTLGYEEKTTRFTTL